MTPAARPISTANRVRGALFIVVGLAVLIGNRDKLGLRQDTGELQSTVGYIAMAAAFAASLYLLAMAARAFREQGARSSYGWRALIGALVCVLFAVAFILGVSMTLLASALIIFIGISLLLGWARR